MSAFTAPAPSTIRSSCRHVSPPTTPRSQRRKHQPPRPSPRATLPPPSSANPPKTFQGVTWLHVERMCAELASAVAADRFDVVVGITRGGMVPATLLCEALQLRTLVSATVMFYTDAGDQFYGMAEPRFLAFPSADALEGRRVLVVDDVWDSGRTAHAVKMRIQRAAPEAVKVAVLHFKPGMNVVQGIGPDFYCATTENWVVYPWERASPDTPQVEVGEIETVPFVSDQDSASIKGTG